MCSGGKILLTILTNNAPTGITMKLSVTPEASLVASSALLHIPGLRTYSDFEERSRRASEHYEGELERRKPRETTSSGGDLSLTAPDTERNVSTLQACMTGMQNIASVSNEAGFAACYNVLDWHENMNGMFQADLRFFQISSAAGQFANVPMNDITIQLLYPNSTQYSVLTNVKRSVSTLQQRQSASEPTEIQQYSLVGNFQMQLDLKKLNNTQIMSLLIPQIILSAKVEGTTVASQVASSDVVYFVAGQFLDGMTPQLAAKAADPVMAADAIMASQGFVLPGTTFGVFPVGLIITSTWCLLFFLAYGLGTIGRIRHRDIYRKRIAVTTGRSGRR
ncbi:hypothetical protein LTR64_000553 [Lithohypha guttulata]|uniref:uncharacterized protein n=1 Tax=Lithohypha guttulata TaxID=1690604 RepID=UPI002DE00355|nr:hypothetical protein LTR51_005681 [Lithohypha guttulata]